ncbi:MAG: RNA polymerase sigma factor [Longimicrobiales bacterium]
MSEAPARPGMRPSVLKEDARRTGEAVDTQFERLLLEHGAALTRLAGAYAALKVDRDDLFQEILFAIWRALPTFRGDCSERTFVFRIAHNRALTHRKQRRFAFWTAVSDFWPDPRPDPAAEATRRGRHERLMAAVRQLSPASRQVVLLHLEEFTNGEIAETLGVSANSVAIRLTRARRQLRALLGEEEAET